MYRILTFATAIAIGTSSLPSSVATLAQEAGWERLLPYRKWSATDQSGRSLYRHSSLFSEISNRINDVTREFAEKGIEFLTPEEKLAWSELKRQYDAPMQRAHTYELKPVGEPYTMNQAFKDQNDLAIALIPAAEKLLGDKYALIIQKINRRDARDVRREDLTGLRDPVLASAISLTENQTSRIAGLFDGHSEIVSNSRIELSQALRRLRDKLREKMLERLPLGKREYYLRVFGDPIDPFEMVGADGKGPLRDVLSMYGQVDGEPVTPLWGSSGTTESTTPDSKNPWDFLEKLKLRRERDLHAPGSEKVIKIEYLEYSLIMSEVVQNDIKLGKEELNAIRKALSDEDAKVEAREIDRNLRLVELLAEEGIAESVITSHLKPEQRKRFHEIEIQARTFKDANSFGILDPAVAANLELSEEDRQYFSELVTAAEKEMKELVEAHLSLEKEKAAALVISLRAVLTEQQIERYRYFLGPDVF